MGTLDGLGQYNFVADATTRHVALKDGEAVTFMSALDAGNQVLTLKESVGGAGEQALAVIDTVYKCPGVGGTWTEVTQTVSDSYTHADATNDMVAFTVYAAQLSKGFDAIEITASTGGWMLAVIHPLKYGADPSRLPNPIF